MQLSCVIICIEGLDQFFCMKKIIFSALFFWLFAPLFCLAQVETGAHPVQQDEFYRGTVLSVLKETMTQEFQIKTITQNLKVEITEGPQKGTEVEIAYEVDEAKVSQKLHDGSKIIVGKGGSTSQQPYYVSDVYRLNALWWIVGFFFFITVLFSKMQGVRAFLGLILSFVIIGYGVLPLLIKGHDPLWVALGGSLLIASTTLYIAHGFHMRTSIAFVSILITLGISALLSYLFVSATHLFGMGTEEAFFLQNSPLENINLRGLLLGGMLIGTLGVLDDITTAQAAVVEELHKANPALGFAQLWYRGLSVGREHIVSLVNTLVLAYTGASFPLLLLFSIYQKPMWTTLNSEVIMEEVIRMLVGSIALIFAVPITTFFAAVIFAKGNRRDQSKI